MGVKTVLKDCKLCEITYGNKNKKKVLMKTPYPPYPNKKGIKKPARRQDVFKMVLYLAYHEYLIPFLRKKFHKLPKHKHRLSWFL